jgi:hypothetical protein
MTGAPVSAMIGKRTHVGHQRVVAEGNAALGQHTLLLPDPVTFAATFFMSQGARN